MSPKTTIRLSTVLHSLSRVNTRRVTNKYNHTYTQLDRNAPQPYAMLGAVFGTPDSTSSKTCVAPIPWDATFLFSICPHRSSHSATNTWEASSTSLNCSLQFLSTGKWTGTRKSLSDGKTANLGSFVNKLELYSFKVRESGLEGGRARRMAKQQNLTCSMHDHQF